MAAEPDGGDPPAAAIPEDLAQEVLLRLPPDDPLSLLRATLVCKPWIHAAAGAGFLRRLHEVHGAAPVLGFLHNSQICYLPRFVPTTASPFSLPAPDHRSWRALNYRHGRALFIAVDWEGPQDLLVWEPITGRRRRVPAPSTFWLHLANAAVLCAADGCDHRGCHGGPFSVAFTCINDESQRSACVYSSETETWGEPTTLDVPFDFKDPGVLLGTLLVYFPSAMGFVLEYDLAKNRLNLFKVPDMPEGSHRRRVVLMLTENSGLGAAIALGSCLYLWSREQEEDGGEARWVQSRVINLCNLIRIGVVEAPHESPEVMGFADGANTIFVETVAGLFTIDLHSEQARKVCEKNRCTRPLIPIVSFYTPGCKLQAPAGEREGKEEKTLERARARAHELFDQGSKLIKEGDFLNAAECLSHALKKMIACYGRNVPECADTYFKYGCALLHKAQDSSWGKYVEGDSEKGDESDSNLNLALKLLHCARSIVEKGQANTREKVKIFFALADVSLERDEFDSMLDYYFKASAILENLVEPDHRRMVELYFRICFVLELRSMLEDAIPYCAKAMSVCNAHAQQLQNALEALLVDSDASVDEEGSEKSALEDEIELFTGIWAELKEKHVKLVQTVSSPSSVDDETVKRNLPRRRATGKLAMLCQELQVSLELRQQDDQPATVVSPSVRGAMTANKSQEIEMCPEPEWVSLWCASI